MKIFLINSKEESICPCCGSPLKYRDSRRRVHKIAGGDKEWYLIRRLKCTGDKCGRLHNELPDCICPYKHYDAGLIEDVADGVVSEEDNAFDVGGVCHDGSGSCRQDCSCLRMGIPYPLFHAWCKDNPQRRGFRAALVG